jgi:hypothetical protein
MEELILHKWLNDDGRLPVITRAALKLDSADVDEQVIQRMVELGFAAADTRKQVLEDHHNQLTTTYYLLVHQKELDEQLFMKKRPKPEPVQPVSVPEHKDEIEPSKSGSESGKHCIIS